MDNQTQEFQIKINYNSDDYKKVFLNNYFLNKRIIIIGCILPILLGLAFVAFLFMDSTFTINFTEGLFLFFMGSVMLLVFLRPILTRNSFTRRWDTTHESLKEVTMIFSEEGITFVNRLLNQKLNWHHIHRIVELKEFFCIYINSMEYRIVPKRLLTGEEVIIVRDILFRNNSIKYSMKSLGKIEP